MVVSRPNLPSWTSAAASRVDLEGRVSSINTRMEQSGHHSDADLGFGERALSAGRAAVLSVFIVNPLDVAKTRLQAQATGVPYHGAYQVSFLKQTRRYSGALDVLFKVIIQLRRRMLDVVGEEASAPAIIGAKFSAGFITGYLAAAATCPLDKDPQRASKMTTRTTLAEILRDGGAKGLFTGVDLGVGRADPSVVIVVSFYEVVKYAIHKRNQSS